ncbi:hypothetical protein Acr_12g0003410 [Actinidia rufa]|uniref:Uncharacterized protein n=1 Tax=Actinidia rufa TaxID=165716 RepID=A0A7J0FGJ1_9ERIC|nr:hypothetical protein Acr_12g0003410 [Actinidia rufa]
MTNASSWGRCNPLKSSLVKVMGWRALDIVMERLLTSSSACILTYLACPFRDEVEHPPDPNPSWIIWVLPTVGLLSAYPLSEGVGLDFPLPLHKIFILDFHKHLGYRGVKRRQHQVGQARWSPRMSFINSPLGIPLGSLTFKLATISQLRSPNKSMVLRDNFLNHDLIGPFKVAKNILHITSSEYPCTIIKFLYKSMWSMWLGLPYQGIHSNRGICASVDGIDPSIQFLNFLGGRLVAALVSSVISARNLGHPIGKSSEMDQHLLEEMRGEEVDCLWRDVVLGGRFISFVILICLAIPCIS